MPAHSADLADPKNVIRVLLALVTEAGGELRVKAQTYDSQDRKKMLTVDFDPKRAQLVLRATNFLGNPLVVNPESFGWTQPENVAPREMARTQAQREVERRSIPSDEQLAELEEQLARKQNLVRHSTDGTTPNLFRTVPLTKKPE